VQLLLSRLEQCDQQKGAHVRIELSDEDKDRLHALFSTIRTWSEYHSMRRHVKSASIFIQVWFWTYGWFPFMWVIWWWIWVSKSGKIFYAQGLFACHYYLGLSPRKPEVEDEDAWCDWLQKNLNGGDKDPSVGQYSIGVIVGWSRERILEIVVQPVIVFLADLGMDLGISLG
jgi:hypothetical protein